MTQAAIPRKGIPTKAAPPPPPPPPPPPATAPVPPEPTITLALPSEVTPLSNKADMPGTHIEDAPTLVDPKAPAAIPTPPPPPPSLAAKKQKASVNIKVAPETAPDLEVLSDRTRAEMEHGRNRIKQHVQTVAVDDGSGHTVKMELSPRTIAEMNAGRAKISAHQTRDAEREAAHAAERQAEDTQEETE